MKTSTVAVLAASALAIPAAHAEFSVQFDVGGSRYAKSLCEGTVGVCDRRGDFQRWLAGYQFDNGLGVELAHVDYGSVFVDSSNQMWGSLKSRALTAGLSYRQPLWRGLGVVARGGVAWQKATLEHPLFGESSRTTSQPYLGVGVTLALKPYWQLELGADVSRARHFSLFDDKARNLSAWHVGSRFSF